MARAQFTHSSAGYVAVLRSAGVRADLQRRAEQVRTVAAPQFAAEEVSGEPVQVVADSYIGRGRAGATIIAVHPAALRIEQRRRILGGAIDAAGS